MDGDSRVSPGASRPYSDASIAIIVVLVHTLWQRRQAGLRLHPWGPSEVCYTIRSQDYENHQKDDQKRDQAYRDRLVRLFHILHDVT